MEPTFPAPGGRPPEPSLRRKVGDALTWALLGQLAKRGATFVSGLILARLLVPESFGIYTVALTVTMFVLAFNDVGASYAIARHRGDDVADVAATAASLSLLCSTAAYAAIFVTAPAIVSLFDRDGDVAASGAVGVVRLLSLSIVIDGVIAASAGALTRELAERTRTVAELWGFGASIGLTVTLAVAGWGPWSLAWGQVTGSAVTAVLLASWSPVRLRFGWDRRRAGSLVRFGLPLVAAGILNQLILNTDYVVVNRYLGAAVTGAYFLAFNVSNWPVSLIGFAMRRTAIAGFSRLVEDRDRLSAAFVSSVRLLAGVMLPVVLLVTLFASEVLEVLYGSPYTIGATALRFLAFISLLRLVASLGMDLLTALGRTTEIFWVQIAWLAVLVPAMATGAARHGLVGVGVAQAGTAAGVALPMLLWRLQRAGISSRRLARPLLRPAFAGGALLTVASVCAAPFHQPWARILAGSAAGLAAYAAVAAPGTPAVDLARRRLRGVGVSP